MYRVCVCLTTIGATALGLCAFSFLCGCYARVYRFSMHSINLIFVISARIGVKYLWAPATAKHLRPYGRIAA